MSSITQPESGKALIPTRGMRDDIQKQWGKFTYEDVSALKSKDDLVAQVQNKYALDKAQAQKDVDAFAKGRQL